MRALVIALGGMLIAGEVRASCVDQSGTNRREPMPQRCSRNDCRLAFPAGLRLFLRVAAQGMAAQDILLREVRPLEGVDSGGMSASLYQPIDIPPEDEGWVVDEDLMGVVPVTVVGGAGPRPEAPRLQLPSSSGPAGPGGACREADVYATFDDSSNVEWLTVWITREGESRASTPTLEFLPAAGKRVEVFLADYATGFAVGDRVRVAVQGVGPAGEVSDVVESRTVTLGRGFPAGCSGAGMEPSLTAGALLLLARVAWRRWKLRARMKGVAFIPWQTRARGFTKATIVLIAAVPLLAGECMDNRKWGIDTYTGPFEISLSPDAGTTTRLVTLTVHATEPILGPVGGTFTVSYWNKDEFADQDPDPARVRVVVTGFPFADGGNGFGDPGEPDDAGVRLHAIWEHGLSGPRQGIGGGDVDIMHACAGDVTCVRKLRISWTVLYWGAGTQMASPLTW